MKRAHNFRTVPYFPYCSEHLQTMCKAITAFITGVRSIVNCFARFYANFKRNIKIDISLPSHAKHTVFHFAKVKAEVKDEFTRLVGSNANCLRGFN